MAMWQCDVCGFIFDGDDAPTTCPKCGAAKEKFRRLTEKEINVITRSRFTNGLHQILYTTLEDVLAIAEDGIDDNLDPGCLKIFEYVKKEAEIMQQMTKAELAAHMQKGKWG